MPGWIRHGLDLSTGWVQRWGLSGANQLGEILTGILPTVQVGKQWLPDQAAMYGVSTFVTSTIANNHPAGGLIALERDCYVTRVTAQVRGEPASLPTLHMAVTQLGFYDPFIANAAGHIPFLGSPFIRPVASALGLSGQNPGLGAVVTSVGAVPLQGPTEWVPLDKEGINMVPDGHTVLWNCADPPFLLHAGDVLFVQTVATVGTWFDSLIANFYWWEQVPGQTKIGNPA